MSRRDDYIFSTLGIKRVNCFGNCSCSIDHVINYYTSLAFDFTNGFHDTGNAMATSIATGEAWLGPLRFKVDQRVSPIAEHGPPRIQISQYGDVFARDGPEGFGLIRRHAQGPDPLCHSGKGQGLVVRTGERQQIIGVKLGGKTVIAGDGQVSMGNTVMKPNARKVRRIGDGTVIAGFAGATADAFTLFERLEGKLERHSGQLMRASVELAKDWRTDKYLRNLEALMIVADHDTLLVLTGNGDVLEPVGDIAAIGSGGNFALAAARAIADYEADAETIARKAMAVAADICVFTNGNLTVETV